MFRINISPFLVYLNDVRPSNNFLNPPISYTERQTLQNQYNKLPKDVKHEYNQKANTIVCYKF